MDETEIFEYFGHRHCIFISAQHLETLYYIEKQ